MLEEELVRANKQIAKYRYESDEYNSEDTKEILDILQFHIFLVITYFNKTEVDAEEVKQRLIEKLAGAL
jgi:hypothetical protein